MTKDIVQEALDLFKRDQTHWRDIFQQASDDLKFLSDDECAQWDERDYQSRIKSGRPALTVDQMGQFVHQVANDIRQNTPTFTVIPDDEDSDDDNAEAFRSIIRGIEYKSNADDVYDTAALNSVKSSIGFIRIDHDYCNDDGFEQELQIKRVINPLAIWLDSDSIECDGRDAKRAFILDTISVADFKKKYPKNEVSSFGTDKAKSKLKDEDNINIVEYFCIEESERTIAADDSGNIINDIKEGAPYKTTRKIRTSRVMRYKLSGKEILEQTSFPGKYIPIVPVYGEEHWIEGKRNLYSLIRKGKGAQMMYNVWKSLETEILLKQPIAPVMVPEGAIEDYADDWKITSKSMAVRYKTVDVNGNPLPQPQRLAPPQMPSGIINASREAVDDIKASMGLYNAAIGQKSNETSGIAINARKSEGDVATFHFYDNLVRSITHVYRILISAIPEIYDTARIIRAIGKEEEPKQIGVNGQLAEGQEETIDLTKGRYTVRVVPGASFTTKRQEAAAFFSDLVTKQPELMNVMGDLLFKYSDMAGAEAMSERMKKVVDPKFLDEDDQDIDPEKQQMAQVIQQSQAQLQAIQVEAQRQDQMVEMEKAQAELRNQYEKLKMQEIISQLKIENLQKDLEIAKMQAVQELQAQQDAHEERLENELLETMQAPQVGGNQEIMPYA